MSHIFRLLIFQIYFQIFLFFFLPLFPHKIHSYNMDIHICLDRTEQNGTEQRKLDKFQIIAIIFHFLSLRKYLKIFYCQWYCYCYCLFLFFFILFSCYFFFYFLSCIYLFAIFIALIYDSSKAEQSRAV